MDVIIIGGHGKIALLAARLLSERGDRVRAVVRREDQFPDIAETGAEPVLLDVETASKDQLAAAIAGHDAVVWSAGAGGGSPARTYAVDRDAALTAIAAAEQAGVRRFVMVSYLGAGPEHGVPQDNPFFAYADAKAAADTALRGSSLDWTILMPGHLTLEPATGRIDPHAVAGPGEDSTSRANVAQTILATLDDPATVGHDIGFTDGDVPIADALAS